MVAFVAVQKAQAQEPFQQPHYGAWRGSDLLMETSEHMVGIKRWLKFNVAPANATEPMVEMIMDAIRDAEQTAYQIGKEEGKREVGFYNTSDDGGAAY